MYQSFIDQLLEQHIALWEVVGSNPVKMLKHYFASVLVKVRTQWPIKLVTRCKDDSIHFSGKTQIYLVVKLVALYSGVML